VPAVAISSSAIADRSVAAMVTHLMPAIVTCGDVHVVPRLRGWVVPRAGETQACSCGETPRSRLTTGPPGGA
jgi:hypothetical protein